MMGDENILSGSDENILELVAMVLKLCECTENQRNEHFKKMSFMVCEL